MNALRQEVNKTVRHEAIHAREDLAVLPDNHRSWNGRHTQKAAQPVLVVDLLVPVVLLEETRHQRRVFVGIDVQEHNVVAILELLTNLLVKRMLDAARAAPRCPEIEN